MRWITGILALVMTFTTVELSFGFEWLKPDLCTTECCSAGDEESPLKGSCSDSSSETFICCTSVWFSVHKTETWNLRPIDIEKVITIIYYLPEIVQVDFDIWQPPKV
jgi:hypothetical protein